MAQTKFEKQLGKAVQATDKAMDVFTKAHTQVTAETEKLNNLLDEVENEIARLRKIRDDIVDRANHNEGIIVKLLHVLGFDK